MKIQTCLFPLLLGLAIAPGARAQNDNTLIDVNATALGLLDGAVVDTLTNSGAAGDFTTLIGQVELISHPEMGKQYDSINKEFVENPQYGKIPIIDADYLINQEHSMK